MPECIYNALSAWVPWLTTNCKNSNEIVTGTEAESGKNEEMAERWGKSSSKSVI